MGSGGEEDIFDVHKKLLIVLIISFSSLGIVVLFCLGFWVYRKNQSPKSINNSGNETLMNKSATNVMWYANNLECLMISSFFYCSLRFCGCSFIFQVFCDYLCLIFVQCFFFL